MLKFLLFIWQLPQNLLAMIVYLFANPRGLSCTFDGQWHDYYVAQRFVGGWGVSLGNFIFFGYKPDVISIRHEYGHQCQSLYLGWLYLLVIGLPSFSACVYDIWFHQKWTPEERMKWYYTKLPWEAWAEKLGNTQRYV